MTTLSPRGPLLTLAAGVMLLALSLVAGATPTPQPAQTTAATR